MLKMITNHQIRQIVFTISLVLCQLMFIGQISSGKLETLRRKILATLTSMSNSELYTENCSMLDTYLCREFVRGIIFTLLEPHFWLISIQTMAISQVWYSF